MTTDRAAELSVKRTIVLIRVRDGADGLHRALRTRYPELLSIATLRIRPCVDAERAATILAGQGGFVFASANAVRALGGLLRAWQPHGPVFAQGPATARALARYGIRALVPDRPYDSEALLAMPAFAAPGLGPIVRICGQQGRDTLLSALSARGISGQVLTVYAREPLALSAAAIRGLQAVSAPITVFTSAEALQALLAVQPDSLSRLTRDGTAVVPSERLAGLARSLGFLDIQRAESAARVDVLRAVAALAGPSRMTSSADSDCRR